MEPYEYEALRGVYEGALAVFEIDKRYMNANQITAFKESFQHKYRKMFHGEVAILSMRSSVTFPHILVMAFDKK